jgi:hypothetical protein
MVELQYNREVYFVAGAASKSTAATACLSSSSSFFSCLPDCHLTTAFSCYPFPSLVLSQAIDAVSASLFYVALDLSNGNMTFSTDTYDSLCMYECVFVYIYVYALCIHI